MAVGRRENVTPNMVSNAHPVTLAPSLISRRGAGREDDGGRSVDGMLSTRASSDPTDASTNADVGGRQNLETRSLPDERRITQFTNNTRGDRDALELAPLPTHSGASVAIFFNGLFTTMIAISTLGTSITFSYVISNETGTPPTTSPYTDTTVQLFLSISWICFLLCLAFSSLGSTLLTFFRKYLVMDWDGEHGHASQLVVQWYAVLASSCMGCLTIAAFVFMDLVVVAYQPVVGWVALAFTVVFAIIILASTANQVPWPWLRTRSLQRSRPRDILRGDAADTDVEKSLTVAWSGRTR